MTAYNGQWEQVGYYAWIATEASSQDAAFYEKQLAQRAVWAAEDYKRYQKAKFFLLNGSPYSVHVPKNRDIVEFLEQHYPNFKEEGE